jgi:hypothetical protein
VDELSRHREFEKLDVLGTLRFSIAMGLPPTPLFAETERRRDADIEAVDAVDVASPSSNT